jgi:hypothetical protein
LIQCLITLRPITHLKNISSNKLFFLLSKYINSNNNNKSSYCYYYSHNISISSVYIIKHINNIINASVIVKNNNRYDSIALCVKRFIDNSNNIDTIKITRVDIVNNNEVIKFDGSDCDG